jgi:hypothetical protein
VKIRAEYRTTNSPLGYAGGLLSFLGQLFALLANIPHIPRMWTHRATIIGGQTAPNDRTVFCDGRAVGRVYFAENWWSPNQWVWTAGADHGRAETMQAALEAVRASVTRAGANP